MQQIKVLVAVLELMHEDAHHHIFLVPIQQRVLAEVLGILSDEHIQNERHDDVQQQNHRKKVKRHKIHSVIIIVLHRDERPRNLSAFHETNHSA